MRHVIQRVPQLPTGQPVPLIRQEMLDYIHR